MHWHDALTVLRMSPQYLLRTLELYVAFAKKVDVPQEQIEAFRRAYKESFTKRRGSAFDEKKKTNARARNAVRAALRAFVSKTAQDGMDDDI